MQPASAPPGGLALGRCADPGAACGLEAPWAGLSGSLWPVLSSSLWGFLGGEELGGGNSLHLYLEFQEGEGVGLRKTLILK